MNKYYIYIGIALAILIIAVLLFVFVPEYSLITGPAAAHADSKIMSITKNGDIVLSDNSVQNINDYITDMRGELDKQRKSDIALARNDLAAAVKKLRAEMDLALGPYGVKGMILSAEKDRKDIRNKVSALRSEVLNSGYVKRGDRVKFTTSPNGLYYSGGGVVADDPNRGKNVSNPCLSGPYAKANYATCCGAGVSMTQEQDGICKNINKT